MGLLVAGAVLALAGCGGDAETSGGGEETRETADVMIRLVTDSGHVGANHDDEWCVWGQTSYTLRDEGGEIVSAGEVESDAPGEAEVGGEAGLLGEVRGTDPYECVLPFTVEGVPRVSFYEMEVSTWAPRSSDEEYTATVTFEADEALAGYLDVEVRG